MKLLNIFGNRYRGTLGKDLVASSWKGIPYIREYQVPRNPKTELQLEHRALFAEAVELWHALEESERDVYNKAAKRMTGYNLFIRQYIRAARQGREQEVREESCRTAQTPESPLTGDPGDAQGRRADHKETISLDPASPSPMQVPEAKRSPT